MRLLHIMRSVDPADGGPIEALVRSDPVWRRFGHQREIVSLDAPDDPWVLACPIPTHAMGSPTVKRLARHVPVLRYGFAPRLVPWLRRHVSDYDRIVVNGLWNYADFAARRVLPYQDRPYFVFTHGMLDPWFRKAHPLKHGMKQVAWLLCEGPLLRHAQSVLFTSAGEEASANRAFWPYRIRPRVSGYGTADPPVASATQTRAWREAFPALRRPYLLFLGRLHPKKGCDLLVDAFAARAATLDVDLVMAGPDGDGWRAALQAKAAATGIADRVHWPGMIRDDAKWGAVRGALAFVLPSHGENFGVSVVEAMACGKPVLISDKVAIAPEIAAHGAGLVAPDTIEGTIDLLDRFAAMTPSRRQAMGTRARTCFTERFAIERFAEAALAILAEGTP